MYAMNGARKMGEILQIRVSAETFTPEAARKRWPVLFALADPENRIQKLSALVDRLHDLVRFGDIRPEHRQALETGLEPALAARMELAQQLAQRQPAKADATSYILEDRLDDLEKIMPAL